MAANFKGLFDLDSGYGAGAAEYIDTPMDTSTSDFLDSYDKTAEKLNNLSQSKEQKLNIPEGYKLGTIASIQDADTVTLTDGTVIRLGDQFTRYDANETTHPHKNQLGDWAPEWMQQAADFVHSPTTKSDWAMQKQRELAGQLLGKLPENVTMDDIHSVGNYQTLQMLADISRKPDEKRWHPSYVQGGDNKADLSDLSGAGIKVYYNAAGKKEGHNRLLSNLINPYTGEDTTRMAALDPTLNAFAYAPNRQRELSIGERAVNIAKGAAAGGLQLGADALDAGLEGSAHLVYGIAKATGLEAYYTKDDMKFASDFLNKYKDTKWANDVTGFDPRYNSGLINRSLENFKKGNYYEGIKAAIKAGPGVFIGSLPFMAALSNPITGAAVLGGQFNDSLDAYKKNNGHSASVPTMTRILVLDAANLALERVPFEAAIHGGAASFNGLKRLLGSVPKAEKRTFGKILAKRFGIIAGNIVEESSQEGAQYVLNYLNREYGTKADKGFNADDMFKNMIGGGAAGGFAGGTVGTVVATAQGAKFGKRAVDSVIAKNADNKTEDPAVADEARATLSRINKAAVEGETITVDDMNAFNKAADIYEGLDGTEAVKKGRRNLVHQARLKVLSRLENASDTEVDGITLGSKKDAVDLIMAAIDQHGTKMPDKLAHNLSRIATKIGLSKDFVQKTMSQVEQEVTVGSGGYKTYGLIIDELSKDPEANKAGIEKYKKKLYNLFDTQVKYKDTLEGVFTKIKADIASGALTRANGYKDAKNNKEVYTYEVKDLKQLNGKPVVIHVNKQGDHYGLSNSAKRLLEMKSTNVVEMSKLISKLEGVEPDTSNAQEVPTQQPSKPANSTESMQNGIPTLEDGDIPNQGDGQSTVEPTGLQNNIPTLEDDSIPSQTDTTEPSMQNNIPTLGEDTNQDSTPSPKSGISKAKLVYNSKAKAVTLPNGSTSVHVNSLNDLISYAKEYGRLMANNGKTSKLNEKVTVEFEQMFHDIAKIGIKFKPVTLRFMKEVRNSTGTSILGQYKSNNKGNDTIELATDRKLGDNVYPMKLVLHEYAHAITLAKLDKYPVLKKQVEALRKKVEVAYLAKNKSNKVTDHYGLTNEYEFLAEAVSSPRFQNLLLGMEGTKLKEGTLARLKNIFKQLLNRFTKDDVNKFNKTALGDALKLVDTVANSVDTDEKVSTPSPKVDSATKGTVKPIDISDENLAANKKVIDKMISDYQVQLDKLHSDKAALRAKIREHKAKIVDARHGIAKAAHNFMLGKLVKDIRRVIASFQAWIKRYEKLIDGFSDELQKTMDAINSVNTDLQRYKDMQREVNQEIKDNAVEQTKQMLEQGRKRVKKTEDNKDVETVLQEMYEVTKGMTSIVNASDETKALVGKLEEKIAGHLEALYKTEPSGIQWSDSPMLAFIGKDGKYMPQLVRAMAVTMIGFLADGKRDLYFNDDQSIAKILGDDVRANQVWPVRNDMKNLGKPENLLANPLGNKIVKYFGITDKGSALYKTKDRLATDLGGALLQVMANEGDIEMLQDMNPQQLEEWLAKVQGRDPDTNKETHAITSYHATKGTSEADLAKEAEIAKAYEDLQSLVGDVYRKGYRKAKYSEPKEVTTRNAEEVTKVPQQTKDALAIAENQAFEGNEDVGNIVQALWGKEPVDVDSFDLGDRETLELGDFTDDQAALLKAFGWTDASEVHIDSVHDVDMDNRSLVRKINDVNEYVGKDIKNDIYFDYFFSKNGRFFIDSAKVNPQTGKIERFIVTAKTENKLVKTKGQRTVFKIGVVQAFDGSEVVTWKGSDSDVNVQGDTITGLGSIDKQPQSENIKQFEQILANKTIRKVVDSINNGNIDYRALLEAVKGADHPTHAQSALYELAKYVKSEGKPFSSNLVMETDGVTSGVFLSNIIAPVYATWDKMKGALNRGSMFFGKPDKVPATYGDWKSDSRNKDEYEVGVEGVSENLKKIVGEGIKKLVEVNRNFMKYPIMIFSYGGGANALARAVGTDAANDVIAKLSASGNDKELLKDVDQVLQDQITAKEAIIKDLDASEKHGSAKKAIGKLTAARTWLINDGSTAEARRGQTMNSSTSPMKIIYDAVEEQARTVHGKAMADYLEETYAVPRLLQRATNDIMIGAFGVFEKNFKEAVDKKFGTRTPVGNRDKNVFSLTNDEVAEIMQEMVDNGKVPGILTVQGEKASVTKQKRDTAKEGKVQQKMKKGDRVVNPLIYQYVVSPSGGAVTNIHFFDGALIQELIKQFNGLGVHDAWVTHVNDALEAGQIYNKAVWEFSQKYDMVGKVQEYMGELLDSDRDAFIESVFRVDNITKHPVPEIAGILEEKGYNREIDPEGYDKAYKTLGLKYLSEVLRMTKHNSDFNKLKMRGEDFSLSQMAGPEGIAYVHTAESGIKAKLQGKTTIDIDPAAVLGDVDELLKDIAKSTESKKAKANNNKPDKEQTDSEEIRDELGNKPSGSDTSKNNSTTPEFNKLPNYKPGQSNMTYAGIGSRETPSAVLKQMTKLASKLNELGYKLQTGMTFRGKEEGADKAFSYGTNNKVLFGPEKYGNNPVARAITKELHPNPGALKEGGLKLMARNTNQVFGESLDTPVDFVVFYAPETSNPLRPKGGTGQAVEMARRKGIPTINMADKDWETQLEAVIDNTPATIDKKLTHLGTSKAYVRKGTGIKDIGESADAIREIVKSGSPEYKIKEKLDTLIEILINKPRCGK